MTDRAWGCFSVVMFLLVFWGGLIVLLRIW